MSVVKKYNPNTEQWEAILPGTTGPTGPQGETGPVGPQGETGPAGPTGQGVPTGGATHAVLAKSSATDYATEWADRPWNTAWGFVTSASSPARQGITSTSYVTNTTASFTAVAGRRYKATMQFTTESQTGTDQLAYVGLSDESSILSEYITKYFNSTELSSSTQIAYLTPAAGTASVRVRSKVTSGGDIDIFNVVLSVEDVGPA